MIGLEPGEASLAGGNDTALAGVVRIDLAYQKHFVAAPGDRFADDSLRPAFAVHFGGIDERHAEIEPLAQGRDFPHTITRALAHAPGSHAQGRQARAGGQRDVRSVGGNRTRHGRRRRLCQAYSRVGRRPDG